MSNAEYTHEKIGYKAVCVQWDGTNLEEIVSKFDDSAGSRSMIYKR